MKPVLVATVLTLAIGIFLFRVRRLLMLMRAVTGSARVTPGGFADGVVTLVRDVLMHRRMLRVPGIGLAHLAIVLGFLAIQVHTAEVLLEGVRPGFSFAAHAPSVYPVYALIADGLGVLVL